MPLRCLLAVLAIAVVFLFCPALILVMFLMSLMPVTLAERQARLWLAQALRERGYGTPARTTCSPRPSRCSSVTYWPARLSRSELALPPPALGELRDKEPCRWDLRPAMPMATVPRRRPGSPRPALALAAAADGVVIDTYGFPVATTEDVLPG